MHELKTEYIHKVPSNPQLHSVIISWEKLIEIKINFDGKENIINQFVEHHPEFVNLPEGFILLENWFKTSGYNVKINILKDNKLSDRIWAWVGLKIMRFAYKIDPKILFEG